MKLAANFLRFTASVRKFRMQPVVTNNIYRTVSSSAPVNGPEIKFTKVKSLGYTFNIGYQEEGPDDGPVILALHGAPGGSGDFGALYQPLSEAGYRVIAINFPGFGVSTAERQFPKGCNENSQISLDFLQTLGVSEVAAWMGHSWGTHVAFQLAATSDKGKALIALSSLGYNPQKAIPSLSILKFLHVGCGLPIIGIPFRSALFIIFKFIGFRMTTAEPLHTSLENIAKSGFERMKGYAETIHSKNMPALFVSTKTDPIVQPEVPIAMAKACGFTEELFVNFDENKQQVSGPDGVAARRYLMFARGGHYAHRAHTDIVVRYILGVLQNLPPEKPLKSNL